MVFYCSKKLFYVQISTHIHNLETEKVHLETRKGPSRNEKRAI